MGNDSDSDDGHLQSQWQTMQKQVAVHTEILRKLRMVKMYRTKNDLSELQDLICKWRSACQMAIGELHQRMPEPKPTMGKLIADWQIDLELINFDTDEESFT